MKEFLRVQVVMCIMALLNLAIISALAYFWGFDFSNKDNTTILFIIAIVAGRFDYYRAEERERNGGNKNV